MFFEWLYSDSEPVIFKSSAWFFTLKWKFYMKKLYRALKMCNFWFLRGLKTVWGMQWFWKHHPGLLDQTSNRVNQSSLSIHHHLITLKHWSLNPSGLCLPLPCLAIKWCIAFSQVLRQLSFEPGFSLTNFSPWHSCLPHQF